MQRKFNLPSNQDWLIRRGETLGYFQRTDAKEDDDDGICHGVGLVGIHGILLNEVDEADNRFLTIHKIPVESFSKTVNANAELKSDIAPYYESVDIYQYSDKFPELFGDEISGIQEDELVLESELIMPQKLTKKGGMSIESVFDFVGICNVSKLTRSFEKLNEMIQVEQKRLAASNAQLEPFAFSLSNLSHTIAIGYIPVSGKWILIDANALPSFRTTSVAELCAEIKRALYDIEMLNALVSIIRPELKDPEFGMRAKLFFINDEDGVQSNAIHNMMQAWQQSMEFKALNENSEGELDLVCLKDSDYWYKEATYFQCLKEYKDAEHDAANKSNETILAELRLIRSAISSATMPLPEESFFELTPTYTGISCKGILNRFLKAGYKVKETQDDRSNSEESDESLSEEEIEFMEMDALLKKYNIAADKKFEVAATFLRNLVTGSKDDVLLRMERFIAKSGRKDEKISFTLKDLAVITGKEDLLTMLYPSPVQKIASTVWGFFSALGSSGSEVAKLKKRI